MNSSVKQTPLVTDLRIVAAAHRQDNMVFTGCHHHLILWQMKCAGLSPAGDQGFLGSDGRFYGREAARTIAQRAGQIRFPLSHQPAELFSEELWCFQTWLEEHKLTLGVGMKKGKENP